MTPYNIISSCRIYAKAVQPLFCLPIYGFLLTTFLDFDILKKSANDLFYKLYVAAGVFKI